MGTDADVDARLVLGRVGFGTVQVGGLHEKMSEASALQLFETAWSLDVDFIDTAPWYGRGLAESRLGSALRSAPDGKHAVVTKVGRYLRGAIHDAEPDPWTGGLNFPITFDYSREGILRSFEQSQQRLGQSTVELALVHDLDPGYHGSNFDAQFRELADGGMAALVELQQEGFIGAIGVAMNEGDHIPQFLAEFDLDYILLAGPLTLLEHEVIKDHFDLIRERGVLVVAASVLQSGMLSGSCGSSRARTSFKYGRAPEEALDQVARIERVCQRHGIDIVTAALNFPFLDPSVTSVVVGASTPTQLTESVTALREAVPPDLWLDLQEAGLVGDYVQIPSTR